MLRASIGGMLAVLGFCVSAPAGAAAIERLSNGAVDSFSYGEATRGVISADGRHALVRAGDNGLVPDDTNEYGNLFRIDLATGEAILVDRSALGVNSMNVGDFALSADGRYAAFFASGPELGGAGGPFVNRAYRRDIEAGTLEQLVAPAVDPDGLSTIDISADGSKVVFDTRSALAAGDTNGVGDIYVVTVATGAVERASVSSAGVGADAASDQPRISGDGRYVAFRSTASNLAPNATHASDVYVRDLVAGTTVRASVLDRTYNHRPQISGDGRYVGYSGGSSESASDSRVVMFDREQDTAALVPTPPTMDVRLESMSADGGAIVYADGQYRLYRSARSGAGVVRVDNSIGQFVSAINLYADLSGDGSRSVFFSTFGFDGPGSGDTVAFRDFASPAARPVVKRPIGRQANGDTDALAVTPDGRYLVFGSYAENLIAGDPGTGYEVYRYEVAAAKLEPASVNAAGTLIGAFSFSAGISADGNLVSFATQNPLPGEAEPYGIDIAIRDYAAATTLHGSPAGVGDTVVGRIIPNGLYTFYTHDANYARATRYERSTGQTVDACVVPAAMGCYVVGVSSDGNRALVQTAYALTAADTNSTADVYLRDFAAGTLELASIRPDGFAGAVRSASMAPDGLSMFFTAEGDYTLYRRDFAAGATVPVPGGTGVYDIGHRSADGSKLLFYRYNPYGIEPFQDMFLLDLATGSARKVRPNGRLPNGSFWGLFLSPDGRYLAVTTDASNLVPGDTNTASDVFKVDLDVLFEDQLE